MLSDLLSKAQGLRNDVSHWRYAPAKGFFQVACDWILHRRSSTKMGTWAAITRLDAPEAAPAEQRLDSASISVAVVDTNAIICSLQLHRIADTAVTIPEVLSEVRDKHTRQALANLPFALECQQPTEESVKAGTTFAVAADFTFKNIFARYVHAVFIETYQNSPTKICCSCYFLVLQYCALLVPLGISIPCLQQTSGS